MSELGLASRPGKPRELLPRLSITTTTATGAVVVVRLDGEVDEEDRPRLASALTRALRNHPRRLVVDLSGLAFCYSVGLNALLTARRNARILGVEMTLAAPLPQTRRLLEITGTDRAFTVRNSVRTALADAPTPPAGRSS
ncbi:hypothetical protein CFP65_2004 [Kitasatospora sp. MMS16-BH015]|uniref:STAS domain-containing protein n=1 Tax=Kitasatospora sp. MMS16-BH015 TaxID=2018025 RepID=UPI000CA21C09|nr:STAS domain-containing protein [Kitasatospora sp. MMS16-BH015]AUG76867.1 hypothetical protein CFP65_2004 [Kitasatospora sp. MMS16-BH015]